MISVSFQNALLSLLWAPFRSVQWTREMPGGSNRPTPILEQVDRGDLRSDRESRLASAKNVKPKRSTLSFTAVPSADWGTRSRWHDTRGNMNPEPNRGSDPYHIAAMVRVTWYGRIEPVASRFSRLRGVLAARDRFYVGQLFMEPTQAAS